MENNEISMFMEVKLDLGDRKPEVLLLRNWTKCLVKIEAIKCFPCYIRITFIRNVEDENANLCVRINIPGLSVRFAQSRTKTHSYGLFWKQNRKRCCIFLAFDTQSNCERHMKWMKKSIKNLELHRQELLQAKRNSIDKTEASTLDLSTKTMEETKNAKDLLDILGPLPKIPDSRDSGNWSRRVSGVSGIYEEIPDGAFLQRRTSRASIASGIYEEMQSPKTISKRQDPPPLPPRKRINTNEIISRDSIPRSNTNPDMEMAKKKKYLVLLETVFGRSKRSASVSEGKVSHLSDFNGSPGEQIYANTEVTIRTRDSDSKFARFESRRNSFSTPDLTNPCYFDNFECFDEISLESSDSKIFVSDDHAQSNECIPFNVFNPTAESFKFDLNVSDNIQSNFNFSCNMSTVNLVGANLTNDKSSSNILLDDLSGYCIMVPIKKNDSKSSTSSNKENDQSNSESNQIYENMNFTANVSPQQETNSHIYQNLADEIESTPKTDFSTDSELDSPFNDLDTKSHRKSTNLDEKVPSYFPNNNYCDIIRLQQRRKSNSVGDNSPIRHLSALKVGQRENLYISSPQKILDQRKKSIDAGTSSKPVKIRALKTSTTLYSVIKTGEDGNHENLISASSNADSEKEMNTKNNERTPRIYQKYATLTRLSPNNKYLEKCAKKSADLGAVKKFASLPRFKKIDFSPLKMRINSVLQRHNSEGL